MRCMKLHLPFIFRCALLSSLILPSQAALSWNSGLWNTSDASWLEAGAAAVFSQGDDVEFTVEAAERLVMITTAVEPGSVLVTAPDYVFTGAGSIGGGASLLLVGGAGLVIENGNVFTSGTVVESGAVLTLKRFDSVSSVNSGENALGLMGGGGTVILELSSAASETSISGSSWQAFSGVVRVLQGNLALGRKGSHSGAGSLAELNATLVEVGAGGTFMTSLGGGSAALTTGRIVTPDISTVPGANLGNRDGHVNWTGDIELNLQDLDSSEYAADGTTKMNLYYGKFVVWDGSVSGSGVLEISAGVPDTGADHRLVLTNGGNSFNGVYRVTGTYLTTLALAAPDAAATASVQLTAANSRLMLMGCNGTVLGLNGDAGTVLASGTGNYVLGVDSGVYLGLIQDGHTPTTGLTLGICKKGDGSLDLSGSGCTYTGATSVQGGALSFRGSATLGSIAVTSSAAQLSVEENLNLRSGSQLAFDLQNTSGAVITVGGSLFLDAPTTTVLLSGYEALGIGSYELMTWGVSSSVETADFVASGLSDTAEYFYSVQVQGNALHLVVGDMADVPWLWTGGTADWVDNSEAGWQNGAPSGPAGHDVTFAPGYNGTVTISQVTPASVSVVGGQYRFVGESSTAAGIVTAGDLTVSGADTTLQMALPNPGFTGRTLLQDGILEIDIVGALGESALYFNGGLLRYGRGVTQDLSSQVNAGSSAMVRIDTNGNQLDWSDPDGVKRSLTLGMEKNGEGEWALNWVASGDSYSGRLAVNEGTLRITKVSGQGTLACDFSGAGTLVVSSPAGQLTVQGNHTDFAGTLELAGNGSASEGSVSFYDGLAMGGSQTKVRVAGQRFWFARSTSTDANIEIVEGTTTYMDGSTGQTYSYTGTISGSGSLILKPSSHIAMTGDVSSFTGQFMHPGATAVNWTFGGDGVVGSGLVQANLDSGGVNMTYVFWYETPTTMSGSINGLSNLRQRGMGALTLTGQNGTSGSLSIDEGCEVRLGSATAAGSWSGEVQSGTGQLTLVNGTLLSPLSTQEGTLVADVAAGGVVDMGGMAADALQRITVGAGGLLRGMSGNLTVGGPDGVESLYLSLGVPNVSYGNARAGGQYMLELEWGNVQIADSATVTLDMESIKDILSGYRQSVYLHLCNAAIALSSGMTPSDLFANSPTTPEALGLVVLGIRGGDIVLEGAVRDVYMVMENGDYDTVTSYTRLQDYKATFVDTGYTLSLNLPGDNTQVAWVNNLLGGGNLQIANTDEVSGIVRVLLNNEVLAELDGVLTPEEDVQVNTANTELQGGITAGSAVQLVKTGSGTLTVDGKLTADWLEVEEGALRLTGTGNVVNTLHGSAQLLLEGELQVAGNALAFSGDLSGDGILDLRGRMNGSASVGAFKGDGALYASGDVFTVRNLVDSTFSGSLVEGDGQGVLSVLKGEGLFTMQQVQMSAAWSVQNAGRMAFDLDGAGANTSVTLSTLTLLNGSDTLLLIDTDANMGVFSLGSLSVADGAVVSLQSSGVLPLEVGDDGSVLLGTVGRAELGEDGKVPLTLGRGTVFQGIVEAWLSVDNGMLFLYTQKDETNQYAAHAHSSNGRTGAEMMWLIPNQVLRESPDLTSLTTALNALLEQGREGEVDSLLAASAGAGVAVLGSAVMGDMERQLRAIRNRTTSMGLNPQDEYDSLPIFNAWAAAEGDSRELKADGTAAGYRLSSWGATVGADFDFSPTFTAGLAVTGMYGDLSAKSPDVASGDVDHYYFTLLGRYIHHRWIHTWVGAFGWADISLNRHVHFENGGYSTRGKTDGSSFGALYELGYVIPLDEDNQSCLQPVANISYRYAHVDAYSELGTDAALHIGEQRMSKVSFGLGARVQGYALENTMNRQSLLEARVLVKMDAGERRSDCDVALNALRSRSGRMRAASEGWVGMEMGVGITIPLGVGAGWLFLDGGFEFRAEETDWNGTVGYRFTF